MRFVSFFAGIGGIDLGLERAGHECVGQVEIDDYCLKVLEKHWPDVRRWKDITKLKPAELPEAELWTAGFPCQDIANLGKRAGLSGERSGLFWAMAKTIRLYDQTTSCWRTWQRCFIEGWMRFKESWPRAGMTQSGIAYQREPLVPITFAREDLWLPTPRETQSRIPFFRRHRQLGFSRANLEEAALLLYPELIGQRVNHDYLRWQMGFPIGHAS
ncbi:hypothetical protein LCGC14_1943950 [marine sediment metagenome]|uniref:DNA (cytosine-5-)-methyltransferase n=1 Tax=marine sediment metagenome TaxID=412755 RepID=A0A0F9FJF5_9ZZZZ